jgi:hypothetical protein
MIYIELMPTRRIAKIEPHTDNPTRLLVSSLTNDFSEDCHLGFVDGMHLNVIAKRKTQTLVGSTFGLLRYGQHPEGV